MLHCFCNVLDLFCHVGCCYFGEGLELPREAKEVVPQPVVSIAIFLESREQETSSLCAGGAEKNRVCIPAEHEQKRFCLGGGSR